ncbi:hypothetical protein V8G54_018528 [Vigna mungo]|uniref:Retrovirus-related Pol polyprotein from transposon TNT 1-94-like beta-barrel domain-containing protein n=1 Tax=Vigna mungo TaxID=3915 RepID=A0AAQ3N9T6_VIGMU
MTTLHLLATLKSHQNPSLVSTIMIKLDLGNFLHHQLHTLAIVNIFLVVVSGAMSRAMSYLSVTPSSNNTLVVLMPHRSSSANPRQVQVYTATVGTSQNNFLVDSGATHHVTNDLDNLALHHAYTGPNSLFMGNDLGLNITHSGTLLLNDLSLSYTLCVPSMQQKILSVSQLTKQTNSTVVFLPNSFYVKNL